jgi:RNA polymerase sigma-70 factor (ECF subfamily)
MLVTSLLEKNAFNLSCERSHPELIRMGTLMDNDSADAAGLLQRARAGDQAALNEVFDRHRARLRRMVELRLDRRLQARIDASDVIQESYVDAVRRLDEYLSRPDYPLFLWLRLIVGERLLKLHRHHLGTRMRDAEREVSIYRGALPAATSAALAAQLLGKHTSPTQAAVQAERMLRLQEALNDLVAGLQGSEGHDPLRRKHAPEGGDRQGLKSAGTRSRLDGNAWRSPNGARPGQAFDDVIAVDCEPI